MHSTLDSEILLKVKDLRIFFELEHFAHKGIRDVFVDAFSHPIEYLFRRRELLYVIDGVSLEIYQGMRLGIVGTNGSGKTTLCRAIAGMITAQAGSVSTTAEVRAIFDTGTGVIQELTGRENAYLLARLLFPKIANLSAIVEEAIEFSELGHFIDVPFCNYSKGMQSRLILSLISSVPTDVLLLDEVLDGADIFFQKKIAQRMESFIKASGATIFVSHSYDQIKQVCTSLVVLHKGRIHFQGSVEEGWDVYQKLNS